ncbi:MAG: NifU family protein [Patescibacteria group bacterium]
MTKTETIKRLKIGLKKIQPYLVGHGGKIEFVAWEPVTGTVTIKLSGNCTDCALSAITLNYVLRTKLNLELPQVKKVTAV